MFAASLTVVHGYSTSTIFTICPFAPRRTVDSTVVGTSCVPIFYNINNNAARNIHALGLTHSIRDRNTVNMILGSPVSSLGLLTISQIISVPIVVAIAGRSAGVQDHVSSKTSVLGITYDASAPQIITGVQRRFPSIPVVTDNNGANRDVSTAVTTNTGTVACAPPSPTILFGRVVRGCQR